MSEFTETNAKPAGKRVFKLITGEIIFGNTTVINTDHGTEFLIKEPFEAKDGAIMPYLAQQFGNAPGGIQFHSMNVIWTVPLDEFKTAEAAYIKATSKIELI